MLRWLSDTFGSSGCCVGVFGGRPAVQGIFLLRFLAGASFAGPLSVGGVNFQLWGGAALWVCVTLSVYILSGVMDVEEDLINGSSRPVASGKLTVAQAASVTTGLWVPSVTGSFALTGCTKERAGSLGRGPRPARFLGGGLLPWRGARPVARVFAPGLLIPALVLASGAVALTVITLGPWNRGDKSRCRGHTKHLCSPSMRPTWPS